MKTLPSNIKIMSHPIVKTEIEQRDNNMTSIFGYFAIAEITKYDLIKPNPVPFKIENGSYWILDINTDIIAVDYNGQRYFEMSDTELRNCIVMEKHLYICSPSIIRSIENNPNCVIDELYHRSEHSMCVVDQNKLPNVIWKKLYTPNTWMFITERKTRIAIICNGEREEIDIELVGIIAISQNCIIATKRSILTPKRVQNVPVMAGYSKFVAVNLTMSKAKYPAPVNPDETELEPSDGLNELKMVEEKIQTELHEKHWNKVSHHSAVTSGITTISIIGILGVMVYGIKKFSRSFEKCRWKKRSPKTREDIDAGMELNPVTNAQSNDPLENVVIPGLLNQSDE